RRTNKNDDKLLAELGKALDKVAELLVDAITSAPREKGIRCVRELLEALHDRNKLEEDVRDSLTALDHAADAILISTEEAGKLSDRLEPFTRSGKRRNPRRDEAWEDELLRQYEKEEKSEKQLARDYRLHISTISKRLKSARARKS